MRRDSSRWTVAAEAADPGHDQRWLTDANNQVGCEGVDGYAGDASDCVDAAAGWSLGPPAAADLAVAPDEQGAPSVLDTPERADSMDQGSLDLGQGPEDAVLSLECRSLEPGASVLGMIHVGR